MQTGGSEMLQAAIVLLMIAYGGAHRLHHA